MRAAYFSLSPIGPEWSSKEPSSPTYMERSDLSRFSPKYWKNALPTGDLRNAVPPLCPGVCQEYSQTSAIGHEKNRHVNISGAYQLEQLSGFVVLGVVIVKAPVYKGALDGGV